MRDQIIDILHRYRRGEAGFAEDAAAEIFALLAPKQINAKLGEALESCASWIDRWSGHVGNCQGDDRCTCGRAAVLYEAREAWKE
jgi:hypothetical protein